MGVVDDFMAKAGASLPSAGTIFWSILGFLIFAVVMIIIAFVGWWIINYFTYNRKVIIFEKVGQIFEPTGRDRAKEFNIGIGGEKVLFLKKRKVWRVAEKQASRSTYWFAILDDGYWYNVTLGDLNKGLGEFETTGVDPKMHKLMRYQNAGLRKNLAERHLKKKWWEHPLVGWIGAVVFVLVTGIIFIMIGKYYFQALPQAQELQNQILERLYNLLQQLESMGCSLE